MNRSHFCTKSWFKSSLFWTTTIEQSSFLAPWLLLRDLVLLWWHTPGRAVWIKVAPHQAGGWSRRQVCSHWCHQVLMLNMSLQNGLLPGDGLLAVVLMGIKRGTVPGCEEGSWAWPKGKERRLERPRARPLCRLKVELNKKEPGLKSTKVKLVHLA